MHNVPATSSASRHAYVPPYPATGTTSPSVEYTEVKFRVKERVILDVPAGMFVGGTLTSVLGPSGSVRSSDCPITMHLYSRGKLR